MIVKSLNFIIQSKDQHDTTVLKSLRKMRNNVFLLFFRGSKKMSKADKSRHK